MVQLKKENLSDQIQEELRKRIINLEIEQGEKIEITKLEKEFGVSRSPVREALQTLSNQGLVEVKPRVGYFVVDLTLKQIKNICNMRKLLETYALEKSIGNIPTSKLQRLQKKSLDLRQTDLSKEEKRRIFDETDEKLHGLLIENANNQYLKKFTKRIHHFVYILRHLNERIESALKEHLIIIKALKNKDKKRAKKSLEKHLDSVMSEILLRVEEETKEKGG